MTGILRKRQSSSNVDSADSRLISPGQPHQQVIDLVNSASQIIQGKELEIRLALACLFSKGHLLIEDIPGVGKTTLVKTLAHLLGVPLTRIQFTNDLLPSDLIGSRIFDSHTQTFKLHQGPLFSHFILADELNRGTPKTQSACLQAMEEGAISIDGVTYKLKSPFFVVATQNPRQQIGTYPLPESQLDRFLMRLSLGYPDADSELSLIREGLNHQNLEDRLNSIAPITSMSELLQHQIQVNAVTLSQSVLKYIRDIAAETRSSSSGEGLSPRGSIALAKAARGWAYIEGRQFVLPEDVQSVAVAVLSHRLNPPEDLTGEAGVRRAEDALAKVQALR